MEFCLFMGFIVPCFLLFYKYFKGFSNHVVRFSSRRCALLWPVKATKSFMQSAASTRGQKRHWRIRKQRATVNLRPSQSQIARIKHHINSRVRNVPDAIANIARPACRLSLRGNPSQGFPRTPPVLLAGCQDLGALPQTPLGIESPDPLSAARFLFYVRHKAKSFAASVVSSRGTRSLTQSQSLRDCLQAQLAGGSPPRLPASSACRGLPASAWLFVLQKLFVQMAEKIRFDLEFLAALLDEHIQNQTAEIREQRRDA